MAKGPKVSTRVPRDWDARLDAEVELPEDFRLHLTAKQRRAVQLMVDGYTYAAIGESIQTDLKTVRSWMGKPLVRRYLAHLIDAEEHAFLAHRAALQAQSVAVFSDILAQRDVPEIEVAEDWARVNKVRAEVAKAVLGWAARREEVAEQNRGIAAAGAAMTAQAMAGGVPRLPEGGLTEAITRQLETVTHTSGRDIEPQNMIDLDDNGAPVLSKRAKRR